MSSNDIPERPRGGGSYLRDPKTGALTLRESTDSAGATASETPKAAPVATTGVVATAPAPTPASAPASKAPADTANDQKEA